MNTALHAIYDDPRLAEQAAERLMAAGITRDAIQLITSSQMAVGHVGGFGDSGTHMHDAVRDHAGGFGDSGTHMHDAVRDHVGGFGDSGTHMHDAARDRVGSFASAEPRQGDDLAGKLAQAGLMADEARAAMGRISAGAALLLVRATADQAPDVAAILGMA
jgi:hypothetical protein